MDLTDRGRFAYAKETMYCNNTAYMISGNSLRYLCALLNSRMVSWFMYYTSSTPRIGARRWFSVSVEAIPVPKIPAAKQSPFVRLVDRILEAKNADPKADTGEWEAEIDRLVYRLYGLTEEEIGAVGG